MNYGNYGYGYQPMMHYWGVGDVISHIFWAVVVIAIIVYVFRHRGRRGMRWHMWQHQSALSILSERFAKGEINKEEYEEKKKVLMQ